MVFHVLDNNSPIYILDRKGSPIRPLDVCDLATTPVGLYSRLYLSRPPGVCPDALVCVRILGDCTQQQCVQIRLCFFGELLLDEDLLDVIQREHLPDPRCMVHTCGDDALAVGRELSFPNRIGVSLECSE
jgi:hypothetical protein